jgi:glycosyltransferase involved in cell wall biosynthesis
MNTCTTRPIRVTIFWAGISGYLAACWRQLSCNPALHVHVVTYLPSSHSASPFDQSLMDGISHTLIDREMAAKHPKRMTKFASEMDVDVAVVAGWYLEGYSSAVAMLAGRGVPVVMGMDTPYRGQFHQHLARHKLWKHLRNIECVIVAGERAWQYARRLGFAESQIHRGVYGYDSHLFDPIGELRNDWPRRFLYVGRYVEAKGLNTLVEAYRAYRSSVTDPWTLSTCGQGPLKHLLTDVGGIEDRGFTQPIDLPATLGEHGVFVLPSHYEPWGVVVAESAAAGLPIIATDQVGASVEIVRSLYNGLIVPTASAPRLADAMVWFHNHPDLLPVMGRQAHLSAKPYSAALWAQRWSRILLQTVGAR